jgi:predicted acylesterase/phospholipase RssA
VHIVATDLLSGEAVVLSKGSAVQAIVASTAIPAAFAPVKLNHMYLADGAITSCTPVKVAVAHGGQRLIVLPTGYACARFSLGLSERLVAAADRSDGRAPVGIVQRSLALLTRFGQQI